LGESSAAGIGYEGSAKQTGKSGAHHNSRGSYFEASPQRIYEALLDSKQFAAFSGMPAEIDAKAGGAFSMFGE
jgi:activator of HSP90 ATPase